VRIVREVIWQLRFVDGRGASFFTSTDLTEDLGKTGVIRIIPVAASVFEETAVADARACFERGETLELVANMGAIAYLVRHDR
jgi:hypothetical protein